MIYEKLISDAKELCGGTQTTFANYFGLSQGAISKWERDVSRPDVDSCRKFVELFSGKYSLKQILDIVHPPKKKAA